MATHVLTIALIVLALLSVLAGAAYEIRSGKSNPTLYLLLIAIPGALIAALKELKDSGLLPPKRLLFEVNTNAAHITEWQQAILSGNHIRRVTDVIIPVRIKNTDSNKSLDIVDVEVSPESPDIKIQVPNMQEMQVGSQKKWMYHFNRGSYVRDKS